MLSMNKIAAAKQAPSVEAVLNTATLDQYAKRKTSLLERLVAAYLEEAPQFHGRIRKGIESGDFDAVKMGAHALKSCSNNLGANRLAKFCQEIETAAGSGDAAGLQVYLQSLGPQCFEVEQELRAALLRYTGKAIALQQPAPAAG